MNNQKHKLNLARQMIKWSPEDVETWWNTATSHERDFLITALNDLENEMDFQVLQNFDHSESVMN